MAYEGFQKVSQSIQASGKSKAAADAIAASIGRRKYGSKKMASAAARGKSLAGAKPKGK
jgi:hypothetical protein